MCLIFQTENWKCFFVLHRFPFNWRTPFGYLSAFILQYMALKYVVMVGACIIVLAIGLYFYLIALSKSMKRSLLSIHQNSTDKTKRTIIWGQFTEFIDFHSKVKQFSTNSIRALQKFYVVSFYKLKFRILYWSSGFLLIYRKYFNFILWQCLCGVWWQYPVHYWWFKCN